MIFMCSNRTIYIQPLFGPTYSTPLFPLFFAVECLTIFVAFLLSWYFIYLIGTIQIWHKNFNCLIGSLALLFMGSSVANGLLMVDVWNGQIDNCSWRLEFSSIFLIFYCAFCVHCSLAGLCERFFALIHLQDYEKRSRLYLPIILLSLTFLVATLATALVWMKLVDNNWYIFYIGFLIIASAPGYFLIWKMNSILYNKIERNPKPGEYSISKKFQLLENLRVFKLTRNTIVTTFLSALVLGLMLLFTGTKMKYDVKYMPSQLSISQILIILVAIFSAEKWKNFTLKSFPIGLKKESTSVVDPEDQGDLYFNHLAKSWR